MDLRLQIDILEADRIERFGQGVDDRANILDALGSDAYYLARSKYEKSSFRGLDPVDEIGKLLLVIRRASSSASILSRSNASASLVDATTFTISIVDFIRTYISKPLFIKSSIGLVGACARVGKRRY
jgi:hypothetical protein